MFHSGGLQLSILLLILTLLKATVSYFPFEEDSLKEQLQYYEIVKIERTVEKEGMGASSPIGYNRQERVVFHAFKREFVIYMTPKQGILHPNFVSREVMANGKEQFRKVNPDEYYEGHVYGTNDSSVSVTFDDYGAILGIIRVGHEVYALEPARLHKIKVSANDVLVYRTSDMKKRYSASLPKFCSSTDPPVNHFMSEDRSRRKRGFEGLNAKEEVVLKNRCSLRVVADYSFFEAVGNKSVAFTSRYIINVIDRINTLFTAVDWGHDRNGRKLVNMGFMIKDMKIHTTITDKPGHYNRHKRGDYVNVNRLLEEFSLAEGRTEFCLVHLFTALSFENGVLGLAYISSPEPSPPGGICSTESAAQDSTLYSHNTALSSTRTTQGGVVVSREADLVTAHELGHNWGATHDDQQPDCNPSYKRGGSFIMNVYSVSGYDENNYKFSPCSKLMIEKVLARKSHKCFEEEKGSFCGNGRVERNDDGVMEECDVGGKLWGEDKCCNADCTLKVGMECSPKNSPCCSEDCHFLPSNHTCLHENPYQCRGSSFCTGYSGECPEPAPIADRTKCLDEGECRNGTCVSFCECHGMEPCICPKVEDSCYRCCRPRSETQNKRCSLFAGAPKYMLSDGTRCVQGHCSKGICIREVTDGVSHIWVYFQSYDKGNFVKIFKDNLVGIIALFMLLVWIPISCVFHKNDESRARKSRVEKNVEVICESRYPFSYRD